MRAIGRENLLRCGIVKNPPLPLTVAYERQQNDAPDPMDHIIFLDINVDERNSRCLRAYLSAFDDSLMIVGGRDLEILWLFSKAVVVVFHRTAEVSGNDRAYYSVTSVQTLKKRDKTRRALLLSQ